MWSVLSPITHSVNEIECIHHRGHRGHKEYTENAFFENSFYNWMGIYRYDAKRNMHVVGVVTDHSHRERTKGGQVSGKTPTTCRRVNNLTSLV